MTIVSPEHPRVSRGIRPVTGAGVPFAQRLAAFGNDVAVRGPDGDVTYATLADMVADRGLALGSTRRLVLVAGANRLDPLVTYLAALAGGHPVLLVPDNTPAAVAAMTQTYDPDVVHAGHGLEERRAGTAHRLHPDLALLLGTSGSTGSPKTVRLSATNVESNAEAIARYLHIVSTDVAATTLPMHYCYGLSVVNSHLLSGASLLLTERSVTDPALWAEFRAAEATTFAAVPYTFDLLDRIGFASMDLPSLRYVTQAGGRLEPSRVRRFAELGRRRGWDLVVMYGQSEATARMAYLPPDRALTSPGAIGVPVPGGSFRLEPLTELPALPATGGEEGSQVGELVYDGPNVMLGYAEAPGDLALGRTTTSLRTGDIARRTPDGLYEIVGRRSRFAKVFGVRIDLDQVERHFATDGVVASCAAAHGTAGERLVVAVCDDAAPVDERRVLELAQRHAGLPPVAITVRTVRQVPRLPNGKPDYQAVAALAATRAEAAAASAVRDPGESRARLRQAYAEALGRDVVTDQDSFVSLRGDSLSYVELSLCVEEILGHLPPNWHTTAIGGLAPARRARPGRSVETSVLLRAAAIVAIVGSHANLFTVLGGAHLLLAVAGFNFGRFVVTEGGRVDRLRRTIGGTARIVVPSGLCIGLAAAVTPGLDWRNALLLNGVLGPRDWAEPAWHYWFVEALVYTLVGVTCLLALPWVDRLERRWAFWFPLGLAGLGLLTRYEIVDPLGGDVIHRAHVLFWLFALGWATARADRLWQRLLVTGVVVATVPGFFGDAQREAVVIAGMALLMWVPCVHVPKALAPLLGVLASASLYVYLVHWHVYPHLEQRLPWLATVLSLAAGVVLWWCAQKALALLRISGVLGTPRASARASSRHRRTAGPWPGNVIPPDRVRSPRGVRQIDLTLPSTARTSADAGMSAGMSKVGDA